MGKRTMEDMTGRRIGRLVVIDFAGKGPRGNLWRCLCDCGREKVIPRCRLHENKPGTHSCGCLLVETKSALRDRRPASRPPGAAALHVLYMRYQRGAAIRGLSFQVSEVEFEAITGRACYYCGSDPTMRIGRKLRSSHNSYNGEYVYNGIDRVDNSRGYEVDNIRACCTRCNFLKSTLTEADFLEIIKHAARVAAHLGVDLLENSLPTPKRARLVVW